MNVRVWRVWLRLVARFACNAVAGLSRGRGGSLVMTIGVVVMRGLSIRVVGLGSGIGVCWGGVGAGRKRGGDGPSQDAE